jgi:hypothetical protein
MNHARLRPLHPINAGCHGQFRVTNPIEINQNSPALVLSSTLALSLFLPQILS